MLEINVPTVQQQFGSCDCGLFAIAFMLHLAIGDDPQHILFEQSQTRSHLLKCFQKKKLEPFPHKKVTSIPTENAPFFPYVTLELFCTCHMPETYNDMVECEERGEWFHLKCMGLTKAPAEDELWFCNKCVL